MAHQVLAPEHDLLSILRVLVGYAAPASVLPLLEQQNQLGEGLTPPAMVAFRQTLARGGILELMRHGGFGEGLSWVGADAVARGRGWQRYQPTPLRFGPMSFVLCRWLTNEAVHSADAAPLPAVCPTGLGDEWLAYLVCELFLDLELPLAPLAPLVRSCGLVPLAFPEIAASLPEATQVEAVAKLLERELLLSLLQPSLTRHLVRFVRSQAASEPIVYARAAHALGRALQSLTKTASERPDLLQFILWAAEQLLPERPERPQLAPAVQKLSLGQRQDILRGFAAFSNGVLQLQPIFDGLRHTGFLDEGYQRAQALLGDWQALAQEAGPALLFSRARAVVDQLETLDAALES